MEQPVETLEGWYCLHLFWKLDWAAWKKQPRQVRQLAWDEFEKQLQIWQENETNNHGSSYNFNVVGHKADLGMMLLREKMSDLNQVENSLLKLRLFDFMTEVNSFVSVTEVGTYGGKPHNDRGWQYVNQHLMPILPKKPYICFYPMNKARKNGANWYTLPYADRKEMMHEHGFIGRKYAGKIWQFITGAIAFDDQEWGVTLFAEDPLVFKKIVTEMRYASASAIYGDFPYFICGSYLNTAKLKDFLLI
ncbi:hydrogen peroxide-dependent heme synthase [Lacticaseibacillus paracasei]|uniref:hydrogen peroxide-dependent heme synthase n=1 Tax=Lacticaseibacillus paracasei TaxID=1597 RepID=UPI0010659C79|nr:hydrogen peroxide-dependent heme synthase [Lacticaseibacillus paracasei]MDM7542699.1 heme-dependent peroxidase [Lacticaseibacillus paracasei]TEA86616.1 heme peroxidase [Lacticaseibacillus paracasei]